MDAKNVENIPLQNTSKVIQPALDNLSALHQIWVKFVSCTGDYICTPHNIEQCNFCRLIRSHPVGYRRCRETAVRCVYLDPCCYHLFPCHAGLLVLAVPLRAEHGPLGALATGEIRTSSGCDDAGQVLERVRDLHLDEELLLHYYERIPVKQHDEIIMLGEAIYTLGNINSLQIAITRNDRPPVSRRPVRAAVNYILQNYNRPLTMDDVARQVNLSPAYFSLLFKQELQQTFTEFLREARMTRAKELLRDGDLAVSEIARLVGYEDANYFSRVFKKRMGVSPLDYRRAIFLRSTDTSSG